MRHVVTYRGTVGDWDDNFACDIEVQIRCHEALIDLTPNLLGLKVYSKGRDEPPSCFHRCDMRRDKARE